MAETDHSAETENSIKAHEQHESFADDVLWGAKEIGEFIKRKRAYVYNKQEDLGLTHIGALLVGSKSKLKELLTGGRR
jgi:hypothetical protein